LWAELRREVHLLGQGSNELPENTLFTQDEQKQIAERLRGLARHVSDASALSDAQKQILNEKIDYLVDGSRRLGRKDWLNTFIGVILGYLLSSALPLRRAFLCGIQGMRCKRRCDLVGLQKR
jgi:signal transduction histidine kinase